MGTSATDSLRRWLAPLPRRTRLGAAALVLITFLAHAPGLQNGYVWDDDDNVYENANLRSADGLRRIWTEVTSNQQYYPLVHSSFWVEYQLFGLEPFHFHFVNLLLHALAAQILWRCLLRLELPGALFAACAFALHPVQVESVAWVTERKNVLCAPFYFGAALLLLPLLLDAEGGARAPRRSRYAAGLLCFALAMASKTVACVLGPVLLVLVWWKRGTIDRRAVALTLPLFAIGMAFGLLTVWLERNHAGAAGAEWAYSPAERCIIAGRALGFYAQSLLWPGERVFMPPRWPIDAGDPLQYVYPLAALALPAALFALRARFGRGPLAAALVYGGTLFPALGFIDIYAMRYAFAFDHFQYLAAAAPFAFAAAVGAGWLARAAAPARAVAMLACLALLAGYGTLTFRQSHIYHDAETLWRHTLRHNPASWLAHRHLGGLELGRGDARAAKPHFQRAAELRPHDEAAHNNLAIALSMLGDHAGAVRALREAVRLRPDYAPTYKNLATALALSGQVETARAVHATYQRLLRGEPPQPP